MGIAGIGLVAASLAALLFGALWVRRGRRIRELENERARLRDELDQASEIRETFFDLVTHELRSPLTAILGYQELLADGAYGEVEQAVNEPVDRIGRSARHLLHLIDGVVELSRLRTGTVRPDLDPVDLHPLLSSVADAFRVTAGERGVEPRVQIPDALPTLRSDRGRLVRALDLLVTSAVKHPAGSTLSLRVSPAADGVDVRIGETAVGVREDAEDLALRHGIRIAVADGIARLLGGHLDLDTDTDGTVRTLTFRIRPVEDPEIPL